MSKIKTKKCLYCTQEKNIEKEFSLEHIFPDALGGSIFSDLFKTRDVCKRCNSIAGLFIDGMFIKNFFTQNDKAQSYLNYLDFDKPAALPLQYMGILNNCPIDTDEVCECWLGPHGGIIYHIRKKADYRYDSMIGGNPINNEMDGGTAYIFAQNKDNYWNLVLLKSCQNHFKNARKISGTKISYPENLQDNSLPSFDIPSDKDIKAVDFFKSISGKEHHIHFKSEIAFEQRFLAKLALGVGYNLLGERFLNSDYATQLRNAMWEKDYKKRGQIINFLGYFNGKLDSVEEFLQWKGVHTLLIHPIRDTIYLIFYLFGMKRISVPLCNQKEIWQNIVSPKGLVYIAAPQIGIFVDSLSFPELIAHKTGDIPIPKLEEIERRRFDPSQLPKITDYPL